MKKAMLYNVAIGAAAVALVYAMTRGRTSTTKASGGRSVFSTWNPFNPDSGAAYNPADPALVIPLADLIKGTVSEFYNGGVNTEIPTLADIKNGAISDFYGNTSSGNTARDNGSVVFKPGTYW